MSSKWEGRLYSGDRPAIGAAYKPASRRISPSRATTGVFGAAPLSSESFQSLDEARPDCDRRGSSMNHSDRFLLNPLVVSIASAFALTQSTNVQGACITTGSTMDCEGAITDGVAVLESSVGALNLTVNSGSAAENAEIGPTANPGIRVSSSGTPAAPSNDALLNVPIPGAGVSGGEVTVNSYSTITTTGSGAHGISASSATSGYRAASRPHCRTSPMPVSPSRSVRSGIRMGRAAVIGSAVDAKIAVIEDLPGGLKKFVGFGGIAGTFNIAADGTVAFDMGTAFDDLANGESRVVAVDITVDGYRGGVLKRSGGESARWSPRSSAMQRPAFEYLPANFTTFGSSDKPQTSNLAWPDLNAYVADLVDQAEGAGGAGNSVTVNHLWRYDHDQRKRRLSAARFVILSLKPTHIEVVVKRKRSCSRHFRYKELAPYSS